MADQTLQFDPQLYDPSYNPTEPFRPWSLSTLLVRVGIGVCLLWLGWEYLGANYLHNEYEQHGLSCMQHDLYQDAAVQFSGMIRIAPNDYMGYELRAQADDQMALYPNEIADSTKALTLLYPPYVSGSWAAQTRANEYYVRAHAEDLSGEYKAAILDYSNCLVESPQSLDARLGRANDYRRTAQYAMALSDFNAAGHLRPDDPAVSNGRADVARLMNEASSDESRP